MYFDELLDMTGLSVELHGMTELRKDRSAFDGCSK